MVLVRTQAIVLKVISNAKKHRQQRHGAKSVDDMTKGENDQFGTIQLNCGSCYNCIPSVAKTNTAYNMCLFLDAELFE